MTPDRPVFVRLPSGTAHRAGSSHDRAFCGQPLRGAVGARNPLKLTRCNVCERMTREKRRRGRG